MDATRSTGIPLSHKIRSSAPSPGSGNLGAPGRIYRASRGTLRQRGGCGRRVSGLAVPGTAPQCLLCLPQHLRSTTRRLAAPLDRQVTCSILFVFFNQISPGGIQLQNQSHMSVTFYYIREKAQHIYSSISQWFIIALF